MMMSFLKAGIGKNVPPEKIHVIIYFIQKGQSEYEAVQFYEEYNVRAWKNKHNESISNWKLHAWNWIWS